VAPAASGKSLNGGTPVLSHSLPPPPRSPVADAVGIVDSHGVASAADRTITVAMIANLFDFSKDIWVSQRA
jgi:hypothetical protein